MGPVRCVCGELCESTKRLREVSVVEKLGFR